MGEDQREEISKTIAQIVGENRIVEVRVLRTSRGTISGYYNDFSRLINDIDQYEGEYDIYFTINPPNPELLARAMNRLIPHAKQTTADTDIVKREWLLVDVDPVRPAGISATDVEKGAAWQVLEDVKRYLVVEQGWSEPIVADSGNGYHLLFPIDLPNDAATREVIRKSLGALDALFSSDAAKVDQTTFNAARICKLYGTIACKGDSTDERPHRASKILSAPEEQIPVKKELVEALVALLPEHEESSDSTCAKFDVDEYLGKHNIDVVKKSSWQGGTRWVLVTCPWNAEHTNESAFVVQFRNGAIAAGCHHDSCSKENWHTLRDKLEPSRKKEKNKASASGKAGAEDMETQGEILLRIAEVATLFHTPAEEGYATIPFQRHSQNLKISSKKFKSWLVKEFFKETNKPPGADAVNQAIAVLEGQALYEGEEKKIFLRVASHGEQFYYDLADADGNVIQVTPQGFCIAENPPDIFKRTKNMSPQVFPKVDGDVKLLCKHVRSKSKNDEIMLVVNIIASFIPDIAHPVLVTAGEKGAAKTTTMRMVRRIIDPATRDLVGVPHSERELAILLANNYAPSLDNLESISARQSDLLCLASTGGGVSVRTLYTNDDETFLEFKHCVGLNGINVVATRPDLLDRSIIIELERIPREQRKEERLIWAEFEADLPRILGGVFDALAKAMRIYPSVNLKSLPRMADFCRWGYAIAEAVGYGGENFVNAYMQNIDRANDSAIREDPVATAVVAFMRGRGEWTGYVNKLLRELERVAFDERINTKAHRWPKAAHVLTSRLKEVKSNLEDIGITFERKHDTGGTCMRLSNDRYYGESKKETTTHSEDNEDSIFEE